MPISMLQSNNIGVFMQINGVERNFFVLKSANIDLTPEEDNETESSTSSGNTPAPANITLSLENYVSAVEENSKSDSTEPQEYTLDELKNKYKLTDKDIQFFFENNNDKYTIKQSAVKSCFGRDDIKTIEQLLEAIEKDGLQEGYIRGAYGLNNDVVNKYLILISESPRKYVLNQERLKKDFPNKDIKTIGQLIEALYPPKPNNTGGGTSNISGFSEGELRGRCSFTTADIEMFFTQNETGGYDLNREAIDAFFGAQYNIDSLDKLNHFIDTNTLGQEKIIEICELYTEALRNGDPKYGFDKLEPKPTEEEVQLFYNQLLGLSSKSKKTLNDFESLINKNLSAIINNIQLHRFNNIIQSDELNQYATPDELNEYINKYAEFMKTELKSKYGYSDEYIEMIISTSIEDLDIESGLSDEYSFGGNIKDILSKLKENIEKIISAPDIHAISTILTMQGMKDIDLLSFDKILTTDIMKALDVLAESDNIQERFFAKLFNDKIKELGLTDAEKMLFLRILFTKIGTSDDYGNYSINMQNLANLNKNGDASWFDELYKIVTEEFNKIRHIDTSEVNNAQSIDVTELFRNKGSYTAEDILNNYDALRLSNDPGVRKLMDLIEEAFYDFQCIFDVDKKDILKHIIELINKRCGIISNPPTLNKDAINKLNQGDIFAELSDIIKSNELYIAYMVNVDGNIDDFYQGGTGDCWLLCALKSLSATPEGRQLIKSQIRWADDYSSVTVYFAGADKYITISAEEIIEAKQEGRLSSGDEDVLVIELAMEKIYGDINGDNESTFWDYFIGEKSIDTGKPKGNRSGIRDWLNRIFDAKRSGKHFAATFSLRKGCKGDSTTDGKTNFSWNCVDGSTGECSISGGHAFAITNITSSTISFINPWNGSKEYTVSWSEFERLGAYEFEMTTF